MKKILSVVMIGLLFFSISAIFTPRVFATPSFVDVAASAGVDYSGASRGVAFADYDNDGDLDLYVTYVMLSPTILLRNNGDGTFTDVTSMVGVGQGLDARGLAFADYDNDGDLDLFIADTQGSGVIFFRNNGDGTFTDATSEAGFAGEIGGKDVASGDYDNDSYLDIYMIRYANSSALYRNNGDGTFNDVAAVAGVAGTGCGEGGVAFGDYDNDGDADILINKSNREADVLYRNNGDGTFTDVANEAGIISPGYGEAVAFGDYDNDGYLDVYLGEGAANPGDISRLFHNSGDGTFTDITDVSGLGDHPTTDAVFFDYDNDGDLDILATQWDVGNYLWRNNGDGTFTDVADQIGIRWHSQGDSLKAAVGDYDNDGDLDIFEATWKEPNVLYQNYGGTNNWLEVLLEGTVSNRNGVGAKVKVIAGSLTQTREISSDIGGQSQQSFRAHFGLGTAEVIDRIEVMWPSGIVQVLHSIKANQIISVSELPTPRISATLDICPHTLDLKNMGKWITAFIELPEDYNPADINVSTIMLNGTVPAAPRPTAIGYHNNDGIPDLMVKFDRQTVSDFIRTNLVFTDLFGTVTLTLTGQLDDGTLFTGSTTTKAILPIPKGYH